MGQNTSRQCRDDARRQSSLVAIEIRATQHSPVTRKRPLIHTPFPYRPWAVRVFAKLVSHWPRPPSAVVCTADAPLLTAKHHE